MLIWPGDLVFDPRCSSFELDLEIIKTNILSQIILELIKTNILSKIHDDCLKNVTARVLTRFSAGLAW